MTRSRRLGVSSVNRCSLVLNHIAMGVDYRHFLVPVRRDFVPSADRIAALVERLRRDAWVMTEPHFETLYRDEEEEEDDRDDRQLAERDPAWLTALVASSEASPKARYNESEAFLQARRGTASIVRMSKAPDGAQASRPVDEAIPTPLTATWFEARATDAAPRFQKFSFIVDPDRPFDDVGLRYPFTFGSGEDDNGQLSSHTLELHIADDFIVPYPLDARDAPACTCGAELRYDLAPWVFGASDAYHRSCPTCRAPFDLTAMESVHNNAWNEERCLQRIRGPAYRFALCIDCEKAWPHGANRSGSGCEPIALDPALLRLIEHVTGERFEDFGLLS